ncbi:oxygenase MpaB family protein [Bogoriella caseilytica]|uniref:Uncharacterized protein (DUF2236 family) n=1 Tax=Bogoriella caseilytica TaxID=56055 RepID=A0A3N2BGG8_9MICO|nr:oxygenase MpaB family protein [Bogoriella caseilytica]ROR74351.1 uncharacterized protein (DUF2236 family) [Bogoriella caseilytica]
MTSDLRTRLSQALLEKVAGEDAAAVRERIHATPGPRWFDDDSPIQIVHGDPSMYIGGIRALLLQSLHPLAMAAVAAHSGYRADTWGRLARTATFLATTTFGTAEHAQQAVDIVRAVHVRIAGTAPDGRPYRADDPELLLWVHCAEIDSFLTAHHLYGRTRLTPEQRDTYVAQTAVVARKLGAHRVPTTHAGLRHALAEFRPHLQSTEAARDVAAFLLREPPLPGSARLGYGLLARAAVATLPRATRPMLEVADHPRLDRFVHRPVGHLGTAAMRWLNDAEPMARPQRSPD